MNVIQGINEKQNQEKKTQRKSVNFKQNETSYIFVIKNVMTPLFFSLKVYDPQYIWDPHSEENDSPHYL